MRTNRPGIGLAVLDVIPWILKQFCKILTFFYNVATVSASVKH